MCYKPITLASGDVVPCSKCPKCVKRKISNWSFRLMQEEKVSSSAYFITLTYGTSSVPISGNGFMSLSKRDLQLFFKRLRKLHSGKQFRKRYPKWRGTIKYFGVGEYGTERKRPHYHVIIFNCVLELVAKAWTHERKIISVYGTKKFRVPVPRLAIGKVYYGSVSGASVGYTLKYISKPPEPRRFKRDDRAKQFSVMSKGLGKGYLTDRMVSWHLADLENRMYVNLEGGKKASMPRYYKDKIYDEKLRVIVRDAQIERIEEADLKRRQEDGDMYYWNYEQEFLAQCRRLKLKYLANQKL